jgi:hypothetical protein
MCESYRIFANGPAMGPADVQRDGVLSGACVSTNPPLVTEEGEI